MNKIRRLYIKAIATLDFKNHYRENWQEIINETINGCSEIYQKKFGIKLIIKQTEVKDVNESKFYEILDNLPLSQEPLFPFRPNAALNLFLKYLKGEIQVGHCDAAVIFLKKFPDLWDGFTDSKRYIVLYNREKGLSCLKIILAHELGHCFGVEHSEEDCSIMTLYTLSFPEVFFDKQSRQIILKNKWKRFR